MNTQHLIDKVKCLPAKEQAEVVNSLLHSLHEPDPGIDHAWVKEANKRLKELKSGSVESIPGNQVFEELREKYH